MYREVSKQTLVQVPTGYLSFSPVPMTDRQDGYLSFRLDYLFYFLNHTRGLYTIYSSMPSNLVTCYDVDF